MQNRRPRSSEGHRGAACPRDLGSILRLLLPEGLSEPGALPGVAALQTWELGPSGLVPAGPSSRELARGWLHGQLTSQYCRWAGLLGAVVQDTMASGLHLIPSSAPARA